MKAYKGFYKDMTCSPNGVPFQYEEGKEYHEDNAELCESGFHACENPLDCFSYYAPGESVYHEVELDELSDKESDDSIICGKHIKIGARLSVAKICELYFEYVQSKTTNSEHGKDNANLSARNKSSLSAQDWSSLSAGKNSIIAAFNSKAKGGMNTLIALANREWNGDEYVITDFNAAIVDGEKIKPDTWYKLENGEFVEVEDDT